jgi:hypothetical protein
MAMVTAPASILRGAPQVRHAPQDDGILVAVILRCRRAASASKDDGVRTVENN